MKRLLGPLTLFLCLASTSYGQDIKDNQKVKDALKLAQAWLDAQRAYEEIPGLAAAIVYDQELIWSGGYGMSNPNTGATTTEETIHSICSISKLFTGIAIMQLEEQGKLRLDDPISKHLPWFKELEQQYSEAPEITIEGVLTHSAGLPRESDHPYWTGDFQFPEKEMIIEGLKNQETLYEPWQYFQYSNLGLTLAGQVVEQASGMKYEDYIQQNILNILKMSNTRPFMPKELHGSTLAIGYTAKTRDGDRKEVPFFEGNGINAAAGFSSTVNDLAVFASWQLETYNGNNEDVLQRNTLRDMYRVHYMDPNWRTSWGIGFSVREMDGKTVVGHGGSCPGYRSQLLIEPESKIAVVFMANASGVNTNTYTRELYQMMAPALKNKGNGETDDRPDFSKFEGTYNSSPWWGEEYIFQAGDQLGAVSLPSTNPSNYTKLKHIEGNTFRRIRSDDNLGETWEFKEENGKVVGYTMHSNYYPRID